MRSSIVATHLRNGRRPVARPYGRVLWPALPPCVTAGRASACTRRVRVQVEGVREAQ